MTVPRTFRLQPVLTLKERREEQLQSDLATRLAHEEGQRRALVALEQERDHHRQGLDDLHGDGPLDLFAVGVTWAYLGHVDQHVSRQSVAVADAQAATAATREALLTAAQERMALEKLRDRQRQALRRHLLMLEAKGADETAMARYHRRGERE
jgi:flagellar export protein FliJ